MIIGTAGHIDHGKSSLLKALTGIDPDRLKEEKARGITIDLGYVYTPLPNGGVLGFVDVPGHEKLVHNMLAGATGIDFVLLVIAADDGPMPQTREHLAIIDLLELGRGVVALTKTDRATPARIGAVTGEIRALLSGTRLAGCPVFPLSSATGAGVAQLRAHLERQATDHPGRSPSGHFRLAVDRSFSLPGAGVVVTGFVFSGKVHSGDRLFVSPEGREVRVRGIHAQNRPSETGSAGLRCALNIVGDHFEKADVRRGDWLVEMPIHAPTQRLDAQFKLLATEQKALRHWTPVHLHIAASDVIARLALLEGETLEPGATGLVQIITDKPVCALHGDRFILRDQSATRTIGGGSVLDPFPPARGRRAKARLALLRAMQESDPGEALRLILAHATCEFDLLRFSKSRNMRLEETLAMGQRMSLQIVNTSSRLLAFAPERWMELKQLVLDRLAVEHQQSPDSPGPDRTRLHRMALHALAREAFDILLDELLTAAKVVQSGPWLHLPHHQVTLGPAEEQLWLRISPLLQKLPFQPPRVRDIAQALALNENRVRLLLRQVARTGEVHLVANDHYFSKHAVHELAAIAGNLAEKNGVVRAAEFRDRIDTGRKLAIQILEFFDRIGYTRRTGDTHRIRRENALRLNESL